MLTGLLVSPWPTFVKKRSVGITWSTSAGKSPLPGKVEGDAMLPKAYKWWDWCIGHEHASGMFYTHVFVSTLLAAHCSLVYICFIERELLWLYECDLNWVCVFDFILWIMCNWMYFVNEWFQLCQNSDAVMAQFWQITIWWGDTVVSRSPSSDMVCEC